MSIWTMRNVCIFFFSFKLQSQSCTSAAKKMLLKLVTYFAISCINVSAWMLLGKCGLHFLHIVFGLRFIMSELTKIYHSFLSTSQEHFYISVCGQGNWGAVHLLAATLHKHRNTLQGFMNIEHIAHVHHSDKHVKIICLYRSNTIST